MFYIGQKVVCVSSHTNQLIVDKIYTITGIGFCCSELVSVGVCLGIATACPCGKIISAPGDENLFYSSRFVPLEEYLENETAINEMIKESNIQILK